MIKATIVDSSLAAPTQQTTFLLNEHPLLANNAIKLTYAVNADNKAAPMQPEIIDLVYLHYSATPTISR